MDLRANQMNLQGLLRFAIKHTQSEDPTADSQYNQMDPERKQFLETALKNMTVDVIEEFRKAIETLESTSATDDEKLVALNVIREFVDNLDFANNFIKLGGSKILLNYLKAEDTELRVAAIYVVAEMSQNNPFAQEHFTNAQVIPLLTSYFSTSQDVASSSIHAVSALVRNYPPGLVDFLKAGGIAALVDCLNTQNTRAFIKAVFLIACLSTESEEVRDSFVSKNAVSKLWQFVEQPADGFDVKVETVLYALSELTKSNKCKPDTTLKSNMQNLLNEIVGQNEKLPQSEEIVAYAKLILSNIK